MSPDSERGYPLWHASVAVRPLKPVDRWSRLEHSLALSVAGMVLAGVGDRTQEHRSTVNISFHLRRKMTPEEAAAITALICLQERPGAAGEAASIVPQGNGPEASKGPRKRPSAEAEQFARAMMMPREHFAASVQELGGVRPSDTEKVRILALRYNVEPSDAKKRLKDLDKIYLSNLSK